PAKAMKAKGVNKRGEVNPEQLGKAISLAENRRLFASDHPTIAPVGGLYSTMLEAPHSAFAEAIRSIKVAIDLSPKASAGRIIGFTSSIPNEGKSSIASAVARLAAQTGARTLLIDCDLRNPTLSRLLAPNAQFG